MKMRKQEWGTKGEDHLSNAVELCFVQIHMVAEENIFLRSHEVKVADMVLLEYITPCEANGSSRRPTFKGALE